MAGMGGDRGGGISSGSFIGGPGGGYTAYASKVMGGWPSGQNIMGGPGTALSRTDPRKWIKPKQEDPWYFDLFTGSRTRGPLGAGFNADQTAQKEWQQTIGNIFRELGTEKYKPFNAQAMERFRQDLGSRFGVPAENIGGWFGPEGAITSSARSRPAGQFIAAGKGFNPWNFFAPDINPITIFGEEGGLGGGPGGPFLTDEDRKRRAGLFSKRERLAPVSGAGGGPGGAPTVGGSGDVSRLNLLEGAEFIPGGSIDSQPITPRGMDIPGILEGPTNPSSTYYGKIPNWATEQGQPQSLEGLINPITQAPLKYWNYKGFGIPETTSEKAFPNLPSLPRNTLIPGLGEEQFRDKSTTKIFGPGGILESFETERTIPREAEYSSLDPVSRLIAEQLFGIGTPKAGPNQLGVPLLDRFGFQGPMGTPKRAYMDAANQLAQRGLPIPKYMLEDESGAVGYRQNFDSMSRLASELAKVPNLSDPEQLLAHLSELLKKKKIGGPTFPGEPSLEGEEPEGPSPYPYTIMAGQEPTQEELALQRSGLDQQREQEIRDILGQFRLFSPGATPGTSSSLAQALQAIQQRYGGF